MFRFSIRDVLWLTVVVALGVTWLMDRDKIRRERDQLAKHEAQLALENKKWKEEATRARVREHAVTKLLDEIALGLLERDINPQELVASPIAKRALRGLKSRPPTDDPTSQTRPNP